MTTAAALPAKDLTDPSINEVSLPHAEFAGLRRTAPVARVGQLQVSYR
jgi:hypothetical protein